MYYIYSKFDYRLTEFFLYYRITQNANERAMMLKAIELYKSV